MKLLSRLGSLLDGGLPLLFCLLALLAGYTHGRDTAEQEGKARIAALQTAWAEQERGRAEAVAAAEKSARERLAAEVERGDRLAAELNARTQALDAARADLNRRIRDVSETARRDCPGLPAGWVRLYNEALGLAGTDAGHSVGGESSGSGGAADASGSAGAAGTGIQPDALTPFLRPPAATDAPQAKPDGARRRTIGGARAATPSDKELASPEDILTHVRDYGGYCRRMEAGYRALITLYNGDSP